jgi:hypothetical protein
MSRKITRYEVQWDKARCLGIQTDIFFLNKKHEQRKLGIDNNFLRGICNSCPIWRECLSVAFAYQEYGFWGGLSEEEREGIIANDPEIIRELRDVLLNAGITLDEIKELADVEKVYNASNYTGYSSAQR